MWVVIQRLLFGDSGAGLMPVHDYGKGGVKHSAPGQHLFCFWRAGRADPVLTMSSDERVPTVYI